jgi:drug/metabolite transporter (DMT)-like permease
MFGANKRIISYITIAVIFWASAFVGIRAALIDYSPIEIAAMRFVVSSIALFLITIFQKINLPNKKDGFRFALLGLVLFINHISLNYGARTITAGETTLIVSMSQLFQVLLAYLFLKETISRRFLLGLSFCFFGVAIIAFQNSIGLSLNVGVVFVLFAAITNAVYFILQKPLLKKYRPLEVISYSTWIAALMFLPFGNGVIDTISSAGTHSTIAVAYIGIAAVIANIYWSKILSKIDASKAAVFLYTIPVMTIIIGFLWLRELPSLISCLGGAIILGGVILSNSKTAGTQMHSPEQATGRPAP